MTKNPVQPKPTRKSTRTTTYQPIKNIQRHLKVAKPIINDEATQRRQYGHTTFKKIGQV